MRNVLIYRHQLFEPSEGFIVGQAGRLRRFRPVYVGRQVMGPGPDGAERRTLAAASRTEVLRYMLARDPWPILRRVASLEPVLIHAHFGVEGVYALEVSRHLAVPLVTTFHGFDATTSRRDLLRSGNVSWIRYVLHRGRLAQEGRLFVCVSEFIREKVLALGFPPERTVVHYIGVEVERIAARSGSVAERQGGEATILHVARLVEKKGTRYLLDAFAAVRRDVPDARLVIVGDGPLRAALEAQSRALGVGGDVTFLGTQPHGTVLEWLARAAVFAQPSVTAASGDAEGLPIGLLEAAAAGVPAVATRHAGIPEAVEHGRTGILVAERDGRGLADGLRTLLTDEAGRQAMGAAARDLVARRFDVVRQTAELERLYEAVL